MRASSVGSAEAPCVRGARRCAPAADSRTADRARRLLDPRSIDRTTLDDRRCRLESTYRPIRLHRDATLVEQQRRCQADYTAARRRSADNAGPVVACRPARVAVDAAGREVQRPMCCSRRRRGLNSPAARCRRRRVPDRVRARGRAPRVTLLQPASRRSTFAAAHARLSWPTSRCRRRWRTAPSPTCELASRLVGAFFIARVVLRVLRRRLPLLWPVAGALLALLVARRRASTASTRRTR